MAIIHLITEYSDVTIFIVIKSHVWCYKIGRKWDYSWNIGSSEWANYAYPVMIISSKVKCFRNLTYNKEIILPFFLPKNTFDRNLRLFHLGFNFSEIFQIKRKRGQKHSLLLYFLGYLPFYMTMSILITFW